METQSQPGDVGSTECTPVIDIVPTEIDLPLLVEEVKEDQVVMEVAVEPVIEQQEEVKAIDDGKTTMFEAAFKDAAQTIPAIPKYKSATLRGEMIETASAKKRKSRASEKIMKQINEVSERSKGIKKEREEIQGSVTEKLKKSLDGYVSWCKQHSRHSLLFKSL